MRVLVVDDDRGLRDVLRRALSLSGYEVELAESGTGALTAVSSVVPDAMVLDIGLPDIDGLEVTRQLRRDGNRLPVLMLTARDAVSDRIDGLDAGADDYLVKPFDVDELKARLRALMRRSGGEGDVDGGLSFAELKLDAASLEAALGGGRIATGAVETVPVGRYAKTALQKLGLWGQLEGRIAPADNVRAALAYVARGEAPLGIVYATDAAAEPKVKIVATFPQDSHPPIVYPFALTLAAKGDAAARFLSFLQGPAARASFTARGFSIVE